MIHGSKQWVLAYMKELEAGNGNEVAEVTHIWFVLAHEKPNFHPEHTRPMWIRYLMFGRIMPYKPMTEKEQLGILRIKLNANQDARKEEDKR
jgi:hypothetical protein